jgi:hypothetical protein
VVERPHVIYNASTATYVMYTHIDSSNYGNSTLTGVGSGSCLDVTSRATANGAKVEIWTCNGGSNQQWVRS